MTLRSLKTLLMTVLFLALAYELPAQESIDYRGVWQADTSEHGKLILIIKRNQLASYFQADNNDQTVYQGSWKPGVNGVVIEWSDGSSHRITQNLFNYELTYLDASRGKQYTTTTVKLPEGILGQWAKAPSRPDEELSDRDRAKGFFGIWKTGPTAEPYYVIIEPDRSAATNWSPSTASPQGLRGSWAKQGSELHIAWDAGYYGILKQNETDTTFQIIHPGNTIENADSKAFATSRAREDQLPNDWHSRYLEEKTTQAGGIAFAGYREAVSFYRGSWIVQRSKDIFERIEIGRFGGLKNSADSTLHGNWRMSGQNIFMEWDDGIRRILSPIGNGFVLYEYKPGRPIDGVPTHIFPATPKDTSKLAEHLREREAVATKLLRRAEAVGITTDVVDSGWGQTFMRWAWPFDDTDSNDLSDTSLKAALVAPEGVDPWWWPLWSENPSQQTANSDKARNTVTLKLTSETDETNPNTTESSDQTVTQSDKIMTKKADWDWPF